MPHSTDPLRPAASASGESCARTPAPGGFDRRRLLGGGLFGLVSLGAAGLVGRTFAQDAGDGSADSSERKDSSERQDGNACVYRFAVGELEAAVISSGQEVRENGLDFLLADDLEEVREALAEHFQPTDSLPFDYNVLVLRRGEAVMLFDTGNPDSRLLSALEALGISPAEVTDVIVSHGHPDHMGGLLDAAGQPVFTQAAVHVLQTERDFWMGEAPDFSRSQLPPEMRQGMIDNARQVLGSLDQAGVLRTHADGDQLWDGAVTFRHAPGHTPGHAVFEIADGGEELVHIVDLAHNFVVMFADPNWGIAFDTVPEQAVATRQQWFADLAERRVPVVGYHLPFPGLGHIAQTAGADKADAESYRWVPTRWKTDGAG